ncbi:MAG: hypothetical protein COB79_04660 [Zetaproteobacteria bacterium]|nr:MAG: hypothetical protein COB79_04660 [Zetaproteobacteria bacterium]
MAMTLRPTDGLVSRLLQQQTRSQPATFTPASSASNKEDRVSISNQAREHQTQNNKNEQQALESQLLRLYSQHQTNEPKP